MDSLLCDEVWLTPDDDGAVDVYRRLTKQDCEEGVAVCLRKETTYMPQPGYVHFLAWSHNLSVARFQAVEWMVKCGSGLRLLPETVFNGVNYLDRFLSMNPCNVWNRSTVQLVAVACLCIAAKFMDTCFHEIQAESIFEWKSIERMEMRVVEELGWRLSSTTPYSYLELLLAHHSHFHYFNSKLTNLLFTALLDPRLVEYRPYVVAASALKLGILQEFLPTPAAANHYTTLIPHHHNFKEDMIKCNVIMEGRLIEQKYNNHESPWSPVTVLISDDDVDIYTNKRKRKRKTEESIN